MKFLAPDLTDRVGGTLKFQSYLRNVITTMVAVVFVNSFHAV